MTPHQFDGYGEKFKDVLDNYLVTSICGHFGVLPSEIGFSGSGSLGASGIQEGETLSGEIIGIAPLVDWISRQLTNLSYVYLGMPRELEFKFMESGREDTESTARTIDINIKSGTLTLNEARSRAGLPLIEAPEADVPIFTTATGSYLVTETGMVLIDGGQMLTDDGELASDTELSAIENTPEEVTEDVTDAVKAQQELKKFLRFLTKAPDRAFRFQDVPVIYADVLNKFVTAKDYDSARWYAERYLA
jgi:hypothetical protein